MLRILGYFGLLVVALAPAAHASAADAPPRRPLDRFLDATWPQGAAGTVIAARRGRVATCRGFGMADRAARIPARCDTVYDVMSMTKQFTAAAILKLEAMGRLRVRDPVSRFLGPVPEDKRAITVHHLLTHTAGLVDALGDDYEPLSRDALVDRALKSRLRSPPGAAYSYSNVGYGLLAAIVERASGMGYEQFLAAQLLRPAGMTQTGYVLPRWRSRRVAVEYDRRGRPRGRPYDHPWAPDGPYWNLRGNGGLLSTARDMLRWHRALRGDEILSEDSKRKLFARHVREEPGGDTWYGYGWVLLRATGRRRIATHNGGNGLSFGLVARFLDDGTLVFWVSNTAYRAGRWNLERLDAKLTLGIAERLDG